MKPLAVQETEAGHKSAIQTGSPERARLEAALAEVLSTAYDLPLLVGSEEVRTGRIFEIRTPHEQAIELGQVHAGGAIEVDAAVKVATQMTRTWAWLSPQESAVPFLRAAELFRRWPMA